MTEAGFLLQQPFEEIGEAGVFGGRLLRQRRIVDGHALQPQLGTQMGDALVLEIHARGSSNSP